MLEIAQLPLLSIDGTVFYLRLKMYRIFAFIVLAVAIVGADKCTKEFGISDRDAGPKQFPWYVALYSNGKHFCAGSIIGKKHILTTHTCLFGHEDYKDITVVAGTKILRPDCGQAYKISSITYYNQLCSGPSSSNISYNIAVIRLETEIAFNDVVSSIAIPVIGIELPELGVGDYAGFEILPDASNKLGLATLSKSRVRFLSSEVCSWFGLVLRPDEVCGSHMISNPNSANNGGGLIYNNTFVGIATYGRKNGGEEPGYFTIVRPYIHFIMTVMNYDVIIPVNDPTTCELNTKQTLVCYEGQIVHFCS